jgi:5-formyltetrahydrofolate cyclo-ligase
MDADKNKKQRQKSELRSQIRAALKSLPPEKRAAASAQLRANLKEQSFFQSAVTVLFFAPLTDEADIWPLLEESLPAGKTIALPGFDPATQTYVARRVKNLEGEIVTGQFGIREPANDCPEIPLAEIHLVLVPGVAFDLRGNRLGRGRGFYDRLLTEVRGVKCGIAFDGQIVDEVPADARDAWMDFVLTPTCCVKADK